MEILKKRQVKNYITFIPGINQTRAEKQWGNLALDYYDQTSFEADYTNDNLLDGSKSNSYANEKLSLYEGDVVISNSMQLAVIVSANNIGKVLSLNFTKVAFKNNELDKFYFLYLFNNYKDVQRQKEREMQGNGIVQRITLSSLGKMTIPIISLEEQRKIGGIFLETLRLQNRLNKYADLMGIFTTSVIENRLTGDVDE